MGAGAPVRRTAGAGLGFVLFRPGQQRPVVDRLGHLHADSPAAPAATARPDPARVRRVRHGNRSLAAPRLRDRRLARAATTLDRLRVALLREGPVALPRAPSTRQAAARGPRTLACQLLAGTPAGPRLRLGPGALLPGGGLSRRGVGPGVVAVLLAPRRGAVRRHRVLRRATRPLPIPRRPTAAPAARVAGQGGVAVRRRAARTRRAAGAVGP